MIKVERRAEPDYFDEEVRQKGNRAINERLGNKQRLESKDFPDLWKRAKNDLRFTFKRLCGYSAMKVSGNGEVDHYISKTTDPSKAYEWSNYRFAGSDMNKRKGNLDEKILDPFDVEDGWFKVDLETFELVAGETIPADFLDKAKFTIKKLKLNDDSYLETRLYTALIALTELDNPALLKQVYSESPLVADAIEKYWEMDSEMRQSVSKNVRVLCKKYGIELNIEEVH